MGTATTNPTDEPPKQRKENPMSDWGADAAEKARQQQEELRRLEEAAKKDND